MSNVTTSAFAPTAGYGLNVNIEGGSFYYGTTLTKVASKVQAVTASTTNYIVLTPSSGLISSSTSAFTAIQYPIAKVVTSTTGITSIVDSRPDVLVGSALTSGVTSLASSAGTVTVSAATGAVNIDLPTTLQLVTGATTGVGTGVATAVLSPINTAGTQPGPVSAQTIVSFLEVKIGSTVYWLPLFQ